MRRREVRKGETSPFLSQRRRRESPKPRATPWVRMATMVPALKGRKYPRTKEASFALSGLIENDPHHPGRYPGLWTVALSAQKARAKAPQPIRDAPTQRHPVTSPLTRDPVPEHHPPTMVRIARTVIRGEEQQAPPRDSLRTGLRPPPDSQTCDGRVATP